MATDYKERHLEAAANPRTREEHMIVDLMEKLELLGKIHADDYVMVKAVEHLASCIIVLLNGDTGNLDPGMIDAAVRKIVERAGGDHNEV